MRSFVNPKSGWPLCFLLLLVLCMWCSTLCGRLLAGTEQPAKAARPDEVGKETLRNKGAASDSKKEESAGTAAEAPAAKPAKRVVARINGVPIYEDVLQWAMEQVRGKGSVGGSVGEDASKSPAVNQSEEAKKDRETDESVRQEALDRLINQELAIQEARRLGIRPPVGAVRAVLARLRSNMESITKYHEYMNRYDITETDLRKRIASDNIFKQISIREVLSKITVDPAEVRAIYERDRAEYTFPEKVIVTDLHFLPIGSGEKLRAHAEDVLEKLKAVPGGDIQKLEPDGTFLVRTVHVMEKRNPELYFAAWDIEPGDISSVISAKDGLHIIRVEKKSPERPMTFQEARPRIECKLIIPEYRRLRQEFYKSLRAKAEIVIPGQEEAKVQQQVNTPKGQELEQKSEEKR